MTDQELDALMKRVLIDSMKLDLEADGAGQTASFAPSPRHRRQMKAILKDPLGWSKKKARPVWKTIAQKAAVILLVISIGFGAVMAASPTARAAFVRWAREWYETHITYRYAGKELSGAMPRYEITALPEGYTEYQREERPSYTHIIYSNFSNDARIHLMYIHMQQGSATDFVTEDLEVVPVTVNGMDGELYLSQDLTKVDNTVTWIDEEANIQFVVDAHLGQTDILRIADSVTLEKTEK